MTQPRCLVRGSINVDEFFDVTHIVRPGETLSSSGFERSAGGKGANQAHAVARAGGSVDLEGNIGEDGMWIKRLLADAGVGVDRLHVLANESSGRAIIQRSSDGENSIVLYPGANFLPSTGTPDLTGYTHVLLQNEIPLDITVDHLVQAGKLGLVSVFNPSPMLSEQQCRQFPWRSLSWLIVNEGELADICLAVGASTHDTAEANMLSLHSSPLFDGRVSLICTLGAEGVMYISDSDGVSHVPAAKLQRPLKDTTGAGDCFAGYLVAGLMRQQPIAEVMQHCLTACAICVETEGAMSSAPPLAAVQTRMRHK